ncbi:MAG: glycosyltransferase family 25 protein [Pseudomonadota bacterium]|nr:glycosyltransferase family 25 protein [Pseudomonadota bacterium]
MKTLLATNFLTVFTLCFASSPVTQSFKQGTSEYKKYNLTRVRSSYKFATKNNKPSGNRRVLSSPIIKREQSQGKKEVEDYFDIITYNLDQRTERWQELQSRLNRQGLKIERFSAVDGKAMFTDNQSMATRGYVTQEVLQNNRWFTRGAVGAGLTSRKIWEKCKYSQKPYTIILQDDLQIEPDFKEKLLELTKYIQQYQFDVLMLHQNVYGFWDKDPQKHNNVYNAEWVSNKSKSKIIPSIFGFSAAGYIIDNRSSQKLLDAYTLPLDTNVDMFWWGTWKKHANVYPKSHEKILTKNQKADNIIVMQTHPLWYKNPCTTSSQCKNGIFSESIDSDVS